MRIALTYTKKYWSRFLNFCFRGFLQLKEGPKWLFLLFSHLCEKQLGVYHPLCKRKFLCVRKFFSRLTIKGSTMKFQQCVEVTLRPNLNLCLVLLKYISISINNLRLPNIRGGRICNPHQEIVSNFLSKTSDLLVTYFLLFISTYLTDSG